VASGADSETSSRNRTRPGWIAAALIAIVAADQLTKSWVVSHLKTGPQHIFGSAVELELARNSGSAFSRFQGYTPILAVLACGVAILIARAVRHATDRWTVVGLTLVLGGALGNLGDRFFRSPGVLRGHVVDFVKVGPWPLFNVADSCITIVAIILLARTLFKPE